MNSSNALTHQRLLKIPQTLNIWEGDRRQLMPNGLQLVNESNLEVIEEYVLWVDGGEGELRAMNLVHDEPCLEAIVGALIEAIEFPRDGSLPSRPKKIVVRDREVFLYLKSISKALKITLELVPELPVIDVIFEQFQAFRANPPSLLSPKYGEFLLEKADQLWRSAPWKLFEDHHILEVELNEWGVGTVYISILGNLGLEFGILAYRSLEALKTFRSKVGNRESLEEMEAAFLVQDCFFLSYDSEALSISQNVESISYSDIETNFGVLDGTMRPVLNDDETLAFAIILEAIHRFVSKNRSHFIRSQFMQGVFSEFTRRHKIPVPEGCGISSPVTVRVSTLPKLADELMNMFYDDDEDDDDDDDVIRHDLRTDFIPEGSLIVTSSLAWQSIPQIRSQVKYHTPTQTPIAGEALPVMIVCTTAAKANALVKKIKEIGGLSGMGMCSGVDILGNGAELAIVQSRSGTLFLINEFSETSEDDKRVLGNWLRRSAESNNACGLIIAKGHKKGQRAANPALSDMIALYEIPVLSAEEMGLEKLFQTV